MRFCLVFEMLVKLEKRSGDEEIKGVGSQAPLSEPAGESGPDILFRISYPRRVLGVVLQLVPSYTLYRMSVSFIICTCVQLEA